MAKEDIDVNILKSIEEYIKKISKYYNAMKNAKYITHNLYMIFCLSIPLT